MNAEALARELGAKRVGAEWRTHCLAHEDTTPSLDFKDGDRSILFMCRAGCDQATVVAAMKSKFPDVFNGTSRAADGDEATTKYATSVVSSWLCMLGIVGRTGRRPLRGGGMAPQGSAAFRSATCRCSAPSFSENCTTLGASPSSYVKVKKLPSLRVGCGRVRLAP